MMAPFLQYGLKQAGLPKELTISVVNRCQNLDWSIRRIFLKRSTPLPLLPTGVAVTESGISVDPLWADRFLPKAHFANRSPTLLRSDRSDKEVRTTKGAGFNHRPSYGRVTAQHAELARVRPTKW